MSTAVESVLAALEAQVAEIAARLSEMERRMAVAPAPPIPPEPQPAKAAAPAPPAAPEITEEELLAISAALGAYFGVRVHLRQVRLISSAAWAQQGRVSIQASHLLY